MIERTDEQHAICKAARSGANVAVEALAGCAKSTTMIEVIRDLDPKRSTLYLAFNTSTKKEFEAKISGAGLSRDNLQIMTSNGLGHRAIIKALGRRVEIDNDKLFKLVKEVGLSRGDFADCLALVRAARMAGIVPKGLAGAKPLLEDTDASWGELAVDLDIDPILAVPARDVLIRSNKLALQGTLDFDDQIYISSLIFGSFPRYETVIVDEAQDQSRMNHVQIRKAARDQICAVGDSHQAIYAWRGADSNSMRNIRSLRDAWSEQTLSVTFRCPRRVVERQRSFVPSFKAGPANLEGSVERLSDWYPKGTANAAVLCRNNAPLIRLAFTLLARRVPVNVLGRDIGAGMKRFYNKVSDHGKLPLPQVMKKLRDIAEADPEKSDKADSLLAVLEHSSIDEALKLFSVPKGEALTLSTGHKAKGLEWDTVYHLNPWLIPSKWVKEMEPPGPPCNEAEQAEWDKYESALAQENNLRYVIETRTRDRLCLVNLENLS
jgi:hypothetical protein